MTMLINIKSFVENAYITVLRKQLNNQAELSY